MATLLKKFQLATGMEDTPSGNPGPNDIFYSSTLYNRMIPANATSFVLSANPDGSGDTFVDDQLVVTVNNSVVFNYDYSNGNSGRITPIAPQPIEMGQFVGQTVTIEATFTDLYKDRQSGSAIFLCVYGN